MVMSTRFGIRMNFNGTGSQLTSARRRVGDRCGPIHARALRRIRIKMIAGDHLDSVILPVCRFGHSFMRSFSLFLQAQLNVVLLTIGGPEIKCIT